MYYFRKGRKRNLLQNSMDGGVWRAMVHGIAESDTTEQLTLNLLQHGKNRKLGLCVSVQKERGVVLA